MNIQLDTDIAIEILRARNQGILAKWSELANSSTEILYSPVVAAEVWAGTLPKEHALISGFFRPLICIAADYEIGQLAGEFLRKYTKSHSLELGDALIAATAIQSQSILWTRNRKHYPMPGLAFLP